MSSRSTFASDLAGGESVETTSGSVRQPADSDNSRAYFSLHVEFDVCNQRQLFATLGASEPSRMIIIDLGQTTFIDASNLGAFARLADRRRQLNAPPPQIVNANRHLRKVFSICEPERAFRFDEELLAVDLPLVRSRVCIGVTSNCSRQPKTPLLDYGP